MKVMTGQKNRDHLRTGAVVLMAMTLAACGGGGGNDVAPPPPAAPQGIVLSGSAAAPNGQLAKAVPKGFVQWFASLFVGESFAQQVGANKLVPNARVVVFHVNDDGTVVKPSVTGNANGLIVEGRTDGQGHYAVTLPVGVQPSSNLIVQVSNDAVGTEPRPINAPNVLNAQAVREIVPLPDVDIVIVDVSPVSELATRKIIEQTAPPGGATLLNHYTRSEVAAFAGLLQASAFMVGGTTIQDMIDNIQAQFGSLIANTLTLIGQPGQVAQPGGAYSVVRFFSEYDELGKLRRYIHSGTATLDPATGTFRFTFAEEGGHLQEACTDRCTRTFAASEMTRSDVLTGAYLFQSDNSVSLTPGSGETILASAGSDPEKSVVILPFRGQFGILGFGLAVKKGSNLLPAEVAGSFTYSSFGSDLAPSSTPPTGSWLGPLASQIDAGTVTFALPNTVTGSGQSRSMGQQVTCTPSGQTCSLAAILVESTDSSQINGTFALAPDGALTLNLNQPPPTPPLTVTGTLAGNKNLALFPLPDIDGGAVVIATRQASGLNAGALNGTYRLVLFRDFLDTTARIRTFHYTATAVFTHGTASFTGPDGVVQDRMESCPSATTCAFTFEVPGTPGINVPNGSYTVNATNGTVQVNIPGFGNLTGSVSPEGSFIVATHAFDNQNNNSGRSIMLLLKQ